MSEQSSQEQTPSASTTPQPNTENENTKASDRISIEDAIERIIKGDKIGNIEELYRELKATTVYIDNRRIGNYLEHDARIYGNVAGRDQRNHTRDSAKGIAVKEIAGQILIEEVEKVRSVYVETASYTQAKSILSEKHVLILCGDSNYGKQTTAIHLLVSLTAEEIFEINPTVEDLSSFQCESTQMYVIDTLAPDSAEKLNSYVLNSLSQRLREQQSYLVITVDSRARISQETLGRYILNWRNLPTCEELLKKHLAWYIKDQAMLNSSHTLTQIDSVREWLTNKLLPGDVDRLAELLAKVVKSELTLEDALARFSLRTNEEVESWFDKHSDLNQHMFMITVAVLNGINYQEVINASQNLQSLIKPPSDEEKSSVPTSKRSQKLKEFRTHLVQGYQNTEFGLSPVELIELDNPTFQPAILSYVWHEYDQYRERLLKWLHQLGSHRNFEVRIRAAAAVGELSKYAFGDVLDQVVRPWANCQDRQLQRLAALALSIPVFESNLAPQVLKLLHSWSTLKNNLNLPWTAATAYSGYVGLRFPDIALRDLFAIAQSGEGQLLSAVAEGVASIFNAGFHFTVLNALKAWTEQANTEVTAQFGLLIFWVLIREAKVATDSNKDNWPTLLWLVWEEKKLVKENPKTDQVYEDLVTCLLQRALNLKVTRKLVLQEIRKWLQLVDDDPEHKLYETVGSIIFTLAAQGTGRERERITYNLEQWKSVEQPNAANKILSKIKKYLNI
ncbi:nSTAND3 domain-containing NTPase [Microseira wollei]|uniref:Novel STAND NTPase 3 domain-containing protein n=1 Tax=Microseira wollei NIES-4236 TaxID=2530354 RepID=A0AAV3XC09_9CYAN|nr:hypothetical protein [Microseira wollei]GET37822.1 hypothetical protein MiSe_25760 [Microseira wollei NIES-4236]